MTFILFLLTFANIKSGYVMVIEDDQETRYNKMEYLKLYRIPNSMMEFQPKGQEGFNHPISNAFDEDPDTFWWSSEIQEGTSFNSIKITFNKTISFDRIIYQAPTIGDEKGFGYPCLLNIYCRYRKPDGYFNDDESDFLFVDDMMSEATEKEVIFGLYKKATCDQIKLEWKIIARNPLWVAAQKIMILIPEDSELNIINEIFEENDYTYTRIKSEFNNLNSINQIEANLFDYVQIYDHIKELIDRVKKIINGEIYYEKRRECTTNKNEKINVINQYGNIRSYSIKVRKLSRGGTNRQCTGIYGYSGDNIIIYVKSNHDDPLPSIRFSQYIGESAIFLSIPFQLRKGENILKIPMFTTGKIDVNVKPGGPIYIENLFTEKEQSQNIKIYIDNGILFPLFRVNDNEEEFKKILNQYIIDYNKNIESYYNIMELYSNRITITLNATYGHEIYNIQGESPKKNLKTWDNIMKYFYIFDGIQFEKNQPYYDPMNEFINIHIRYSVTFRGAAAYADWENIEINNLDVFHFSLLSYIEIGKTLSREIGHMIDVSPRQLIDRTNIVFEEYAIQTLYKNIYHSDNIEILYKEIAPDNIDNLSRFCGSRSECKGYFINTNGYPYAHYVWWAIESFNPGYWGKLNNLYRYNYTLVDKMKENEQMVFLTSLIVGFDMGYYFERFGLAMNNVKIFNNSEISDYYKNSMENEINKGKIKKNIFKKYWYADSEQYNYTLNKGKGCYKNSNSYKIEIKNIIKDSSTGKYNITLPYINCEGHLGFEIIENGIIIGFSNKLYFIDPKIYPSNYNPKYKIVAYDRLLDYKESDNKNLR